MNMMNEDNQSRLDLYRITAQAIGLIEILGNSYPNVKQIRVAEALVQTLNLSWEACISQRTLLQALKMNKTQIHTELATGYLAGVISHETCS